MHDNLERIICCCQASSWTVAIAWLQMLGASTLVWISILSLVAEVNAGVPVLLPICMALVSSVIGLIMGLLLLLGAKQRNWKYLNTWTIFSVLGLGVVIVFCVVRAWTVGPGALEGLLLTPFIGFEIWVVDVLKNQIRRECRGQWGYDSIG